MSDERASLVNSGGVFFYRATAECSACGLVVDIGPFEGISAAASGGLDGWLTSAHPLGWSVRDAMGKPVTLCDGCMGKPLRDVIEQVRTRA